MQDFPDDSGLMKQCFVCPETVNRFICLVSHKRGSGKQCRLRSDAAGISIKRGNTW